MHCFFTGQKILVQSLPSCVLLSSPWALVLHLIQEPFSQHLGLSQCSFLQSLVQSCPFLYLPPRYSRKVEKLNNPPLWLKKQSLRTLPGTEGRTKKHYGAFPNHCTLSSRHLIDLQGPLGIYISGPLLNSCCFYFVKHTGDFYHILTSIIIYLHTWALQKYAGCQLHVYGYSYMFLTFCV